ncbi:FAD-dependent oxidoreductase [Pseudoclavibacter sp. 8L]|uniref:FAD-dependent oxidoreductase n=1 Tax=Pseudoclavibacter sp. 8L TaxID=2653162 RepID=UPI0012F14117|nr:FAD-dependent oxidoreductase [Pseudoclavibacter sp. 8L]VXC19166.1 Cindoxin reductase [Pseudoclavibacter sp. 8L]
MTVEPRRAVAIIGSGPSACYTAQALLKLRRDVEIVMFERLPVPYGLIRYGVAPDHVGTKAVTRQFDRLFTRSGVRFLGNVEVGRDVEFDAVRSAFDATVVATGLHADAELPLPGFDDERVIGAGRFMRILNQHPGDEISLPQLGSRVAVVGNGNVAIDVVRLLAKHETDFEGSDVHSPLLDAAAGGLQIIEVLGRAGIDDAKFTPSLLAELGRIDDVRVEAFGVDDSSLADTSNRSAQAVALAGLLDRPQPENPRVTVRLRLGVAPVALTRDGEILRLSLAGPGASEALAASTSAEPASIDVDSVITAVGFHRGDAHLLHALLGHEDDVFAAGWARRGPKGTIAESRAEGQTVAREVDAWLASAAHEPHDERAALLERLDESAVSFAEWSTIDEHEQRQAGPGRVRAKEQNTETLLRIARGRAEADSSDAHAEAGRASVQDPHPASNT